MARFAVEDLGATAVTITVAFGVVQFDADPVACVFALDFADEFYCTELTLSFEGDEGDTLP